MALNIKAKPNVQTSASKPADPAPVKGGGIKKREVITTSTFELTGELAAVVAQIQQTYSPAVIRVASSNALDYGRIPTGILSVDLCLAGGIKTSRGSMIVGNRSAGKSTVSTKLVASAQRLYPDHVPVYVDIEGTFDRAWARKLGVDTDRLLIVEPESGEQAVDMADALVRSKESSLIICDSVAFLTPMKEIAQSAEDSLPGVHARLVGNFIRKVNNAMLQERHRGHFPSILYINQWRMSIGQMFGDPRTLPGGKALEFATTQQMEITNHEKTGKGAAKDQKTGRGKSDAAEGAGKAEEGNALVLYNEHTVKITKDKSGGRLKEGKFVMIRDESMGFPVGYIKQSKTIQTFGLTSGVLSGSPQSFSHDLGKWRGEADFAQWLLDHPAYERQICEEIVGAYVKKWGTE